MHVTGMQQIKASVREHHPPPLAHYPMAAVLIPAYCEEKVIA